MKTSGERAFFQVLVQLREEKTTSQKSPEIPCFSELFLSRCRTFIRSPELFEVARTLALFLYQDYPSNIKIQLAPSWKPRFFLLQLWHQRMVDFWSQKWMNQFKLNIFWKGSLLLPFYLNWSKKMSGLFFLFAVVFVSILITFSATNKKK